MPDQQVPTALRALFVQWNVGHLLRLIETPRGLAVGISRASHELSESPALEHHRAAAVLAVFLLGRFLQVRRIEVRQIDGILFRKRATIRVGLVVRTARIERTCLLYTSDAA